MFFVGVFGHALVGVSIDLLFRCRFFQFFNCLTVAGQYVFFGQSNFMFKRKYLSRINSESQYLFGRKLTKIICNSITVFFSILALFGLNMLLKGWTANAWILTLVGGVVTSISVLIASSAQIIHHAFLALFDIADSIIDLNYRYDIPQ